MKSSTDDIIISELKGFLGLEFLDVKSDVNPALNFSFTEYKFIKGVTRLTISLSSRDNYKSRGFIAMFVRSSYQYFTFEDYLDSIESADLVIYKEYEKNEVEEEMLKNILGLFKKYLEGDLRKVLDGEAWIEVPFDRD